MIINKRKLPYRDNVSCIVFSNSKFLLVQLSGWPKEFWKFPQGGVKENESDRDAIKREIKEELGTDKIKIIKKSSYLNKYDWDIKTIALAGYKWRGQSQKFFLVEILGNNQDIKINREELANSKWVKREQIKNYIKHKHKIFKNYQETIEKVINEFDSYLTK